jgi:hypothetical protein
VSWWSLPPSSRPGPETPAPVALVLRALGLGDLLVAVPALRALRRALPEHEVVLAAPGSLQWLVTETRAVDRLHDTAGLDDFSWPEVSPEVSINLHGSGPQSHAALEAARPGRLCAFADLVTGTPGPDWDPGEHEARRWCRLVDTCFEVESDVYDGLLRSPYGTRVDGAAVVHPGAAAPARRWPADRFAEVARRLHREGHRVVLTGGQDERQLCEDVAHRAGLPASAVLAGRTSVKALADVVAAAPLVVSGDTGVAHLAAAYDRPAVALFGPTPPSRWAPLWGRTTVLWHGTEPGDPHAPETDPALAAIDVDEVWAAARDRLDRFSGSRPGTTAPSEPARR